MAGSDSDEEFDRTEQVEEIDEAAANLILTVIGRTDAIKLSTSLLGSAHCCPTTEPNSPRSREKVQKFEQIMEKDNMDDRYDCIRSLFPAPQHGQGTDDMLLRDFLKQISGILGWSKPYCVARALGVDLTEDEYKGLVSYDEGSEQAGRQLDKLDEALEKRIGPKEALSSDTSESDSPKDVFHDALSEQKAQ